MLRTLLSVALAVLVSCHARAPERADHATRPNAAAPLVETAQPATEPDAPTSMPTFEPAAPAPLGYALPWCAVDRKPLPEDLVSVVIDGRTFCTCSPQCAEELRQGAARIAAEVDRATIELQRLDYPLDRCVVSGRPLGAHAISALAGTVLVRLCCDGCRSAFDADPRAHLARIATARSAGYGEVPLEPENWSEAERAQWIELQREALPSTLCAACSVQPTDGEEARELLLRGTLVRVCSRGCAERAHSLQNEIVAAAQRAAFERQKRDYPLVTCAVSGQELGSHAESAMLGLLLVRTCSPACGRKLASAREAVAAALRTARVKGLQRALEPCCTGGSCACSTAK